MPDIEQMLRRVVLDMFDEHVEVKWGPEGGASADDSSVTLRTAQQGEQRTVRLHASATGRFGLTIVDLGVSAALFEYDDEGYMESLLRELALVANTYLSGRSRVRLRRGLLRTYPVVTMTVNGNEWSLGRRISTVHYPDDLSGRHSQ